jgi:hypothetical protein
MKQKFITLFLIIGLTNLVSQAQTASAVFTVSENPFINSTNLTINNLSNDTISLKVYNRWGQIVEDFYDNIVLTGTYTVTFSADTLSDGNYIASLVLNGQYHTINLVKSQSSSIMERDNLEKIEVYPNPIAGRITIHAKNIKNIEIYNLSGVLIESTIQNDIDLSKQAKGTYIVKVITTYGIETKKVLLE